MLLQVGEVTMFENEPGCLTLSMFEDEIAWLSNFVLHCFRFRAGITAGRGSKYVGR